MVVAALPVWVGREALGSRERCGHNLRGAALGRAHGHRMSSDRNLEVEPAKKLTRETV